MINYRTEAALSEAIAAGTRRRYTIGADLGQTTDPTAIVIIETIDKPVPQIRSGVMVAPTRKISHQVRHIERLPLRTPYDRVVEHVVRLKATAPLYDAQLAIDHTGVGRPVFDLFKRAKIKPLIGITITAGREVRTTSEGFTVPKLELISNVQARFATGALKIAAMLPEAKALAAELADFRVQSGTTGATYMGAREGAHDDLVLALAIALFVADRPKPGVGRWRLNGR